MFGIEQELVVAKTLVVSFRILSPSEQLITIIKTALSTGFLVFLLLTSHSGYVYYVALTAALILVITYADYLMSRVSESYFDFEEKKLKLHYVGLLRRRVKTYDLREFNTVTSSITCSRSGPTGATVTLRGYTKTVTVAWYGWEGVNESWADHPQAAELRHLLASELGLRNLGVM